jgi:hypothetical protein
MANDYFNHVANVIPEGVRALAAQVNNIASEISLGLDKLPTEVQLKQNRTIYGGTSTGAADAYVVTLPYLPALTDGLNFFFKAHAANTGASTLNLDGLGVKSILLASGAALVSGDILLNQQVWLIYESVSDSFRIMSQSSSAGGGGGNATTIALLDESIDTTNFVPFAPDATGNQPLRTGTNLTFDSAAGNLAATTFTGDLVGAVTTAAQPAITSVGTLTALQVDNVNVNGNTIAATSGGVVINAAVGSAVTIEGVAFDGSIVDIGNIQYSGNSITALAGSIFITPSVGNAVNLDGFAFDGSTASTTVNAAETGLQVTHNHAGGRAALFTTNVASRTVPVVEVINDNATGSGDVVHIQQDQGGHGILIDHNSAAVSAGVRIDATGTTGIGIWASSFAVARTQPLGLFAVTNVSGASNTVEFTNAGVGDSIQASNSNAGGRAAEFSSATSNRTVPVVEIVNDSPTGSGIGLRIQQDQQNGPALSIDNLGSYAIDISPNGSNAKAINISGTTLTSGNYIRLSHNTSTGGVGLMLIEQLNAAASVPALVIDQDGTGRGIDLSLSGGPAPVVGSQGNHLDSGLFAIKTGTTSRSSTTTLTADPDLSIALEANATYEVEVYIRADCGAGGIDLKWVLTEPTSATFEFYWAANTLGNGGEFAGSTVFSEGWDAGRESMGSVNIDLPGTNIIFAKIFAHVRTAGTAGNLTFDWAQLVSNATSVDVLAESWIRAKRLR